MSSQELARISSGPSASITPELAAEREKLKKNAKTYEVQSGDTVDKIARAFGMENYLDLVNFNRLLGNPLAEKGTSGKNFLIKPGQELFVPDDSREFSESLGRIRRISESVALNEKIARRDASVLRREAVRGLFPNRPQSSGTSLLSGFASSQERTLDPELPRIVDIARQASVSCANLVRTLMAYSVNPGDLSKTERAFFRKQNVDAWMLPEELRKIGFEQKHSLMSAFDPSKVGENDPFHADKLAEYERGVVAMGKYLESSGKPFSLVPIYFRHSSYRGVVAAYNRDKSENERHYNTHQSMFLRNARVTVEGFEIPEIRNGQQIPFGGDKARLKREIEEFESKVKSAQAGAEEAKRGILSALEAEWKDDGKGRTFTVDKVVSRYVSHLKGERRERTEAAIRAVIESENTARIREELSAIIRYPVSEDDAKYLSALQSRKRKTIAGVREIRDVVTGAKPLAPDAPIAIDAGPGNGIEWTPLARAIQKYNDAISTVAKRKAEIQDRQARLAAIDKADAAKRDEIVKLSLENAGALVEMKKTEAERDAAKAEILRILSGNDDAEIQKRLTYLERRVAKMVGEEAPGSKTARFMKALEVNDRETLAKFRQSDADIDYLRNLYKKREKFADSLGSLRSQLGLSTDPKAVADNEFTKNLPAGHPLLAAVSAYNAAAATIASGNRKIAENTEKMKVRKEIPVTEYLANFVALRADYSSASRNEGRERILNGLKKYAEIVGISINGKPVDLAAEFAKPAKDRVKVSPEDSITFSGPLMVDGMHRIHPDPDKRENMNARTRFFFEFAATDTFYPTEILEPSESSTFARQGFEHPASSLKVKGTYDLRYKRDENGQIVRDRKGRPLSENLAEVIARNVPIFEREAFAALDPEDPDYQKKYDALVARFYSAQVRALQLAGYVQDETTLNPGATNLNRPIPYFDAEGVSTAFDSHIRTVKAERRKEHSESQAFREFVRVDVFPWDTYATLFSRLADYAVSARSHFSKFPNLAFVGDLNDLQKREFLVRTLWNSMKTARAPDVESLLQNRIRAGGRFLVTLGDIDAVIAGLRAESSRPTLAPVLRQADVKVLSFSVPFAQNRALIERALYVESYESPSGKWYKPDGSRRFAKETLESFPVLQNIKSLNSYGDFQLRVKTLRNGWNAEWPKKEHVEKALALFSRADVAAHVAALRENGPKAVASRVVSDLAVLDRLALVASKPSLSKEDFAAISEMLVRLLRLDDGSGSNVVGKILGASLLNDKLNLHFQKLNGVLQAVGEDPRTVVSNPEASRSYEDTVLLMNNMGERNVLYGLTENRLLRIIEKTGIVERSGRSMSYPELQTNFLSGSIEYGTDTFVSHISSIVDQIAASRKLGKDGTNAERAIIYGLFSFCNRVLEANLKGGANRERLITEAILDFHKDPDLRSALAEYPYDSSNPTARIEPSVLPTQEEMAGNGFRNVFFNYVRKGAEVERAAVTASKAAPNKEA